VLGGSHEASPKIGAQAGFEVDFPAVLRGTVQRNAVLQTVRAKHGFADTLKTSLMRRLP
jgi:hypothetical protein